jgi:integrase
MMDSNDGLEIAVDTKYLQQRQLKQRGKRGSTWFFSMAVPKALQGRFKSPTGRVLTRIDAALGTSSLPEAQRLRWSLVDEWSNKFKAARGVEVSPFTIEREAAKLYAETLAALDFDARRRQAPPAEEIESLQHFLHALHDEIEHPATRDAADDDVALVAGRLGAPIAPGTATYSLVREATLSARYKAVAGRIDLLQGKASAPPPVFARSAAIDPLTLQPVTASRAPRAPRSGGWTVSQAGAEHIAEKQRQGLSHDRLVATRTAIRLFCDHIGGDTPLAAVARQDARRFLERVIRLRPTWNRDPTAKTMSLDDIEKKHRAADGEAGLTASTLLVGYISPLKSMCDHAANAGAFEGVNPFTKQGFKPVKGEGRNLRAFTVDELSKLLTVAPFTMPRADRIRPAKHTTRAATQVWVSLVAAFSGARLNEICKLRASDLKEKDGVRFLDITDSKTEAGVRRVPVHPTLVALGFLDYVAALPAKGQMFPALRANKKGDAGDRVSYWFTDHRRTTLGKTTDDVLNFHSFRRSAATALREAEVSEADVAAILGHEHGTETFGTYGKTVSLKRLAGIIAKLDYPGLKLDHLRDRAN